MAHEITFKNVFNHWNTALPLGNGRMGAMVFFLDDVLHVAMNHYDSYYDIHNRKPTVNPPADRPASKVYADYIKIINNARQATDYEYTSYNHILHSSATITRPKWGSTSYPMAGEIEIPLSRALEVKEFTLKLIIEEGVVLFNGVGDGGEVSAKIWVSGSMDGVFVETSESISGLWGEANLTSPGNIGQSRYLKTADVFGNTIRQRIAYNDDEKRSETAITQDKGLVVASIFPAFNKAVSYNAELIVNKDRLSAEHEENWRRYWRASIDLPDPFLETLWYVNLYALACASGFDGVNFKQACGLNGLWDIRRPSLWGSMWYWDVNIQEAFWPVFSSNQLELGKLFCDAYLEHAEAVEKYTERFYGIKDSWAIDYPHSLYNCIQPWCAQFLWHYYSYSGDTDFLRDKAYPVFVKQISFFEKIARIGEDGKLHINYDISPEQGPVTVDSVITVSCMKELLKFAAKAAEVLGKLQDSVHFIDILAKMPEYTLTADGERLKDSPLSPDNLFLRHPSVLMPIFPGTEISKRSTEAVQIIAKNTVKYAAGNTEIGVFGAGWVASAAAKLGEGTAALRILYENGINNFTRANGLGYEETERYSNHCLVTKPPLYPPAMMEPSGGVVMAVNAMLLASDDIIEVFPAIPNGSDGMREMKTQYKPHDDFVKGDYGIWDNVRFDRLLAHGGFEVSAARVGGKTVWIKVLSTRKSLLKLLVPAGLSSSGMQVVVTKETDAGEVICYGDEPARQSKTAPTVQMRTAAGTFRRIFLGGDRHTDFYKAVDSFVCPYLLGSTYQYYMLPHIFDFGVKAEKDYDNAYHRGFIPSGRAMVFYGMPKQIEVDAYNPNLGYGFAKTDGLKSVDRGVPDDIRRSFVEGTDNGEFWIELPRGKYNILLISGDEEGESLTHITLPHINAKIKGEKQRAGFYQCKTIPFVQERDGVFKVGLETEKGLKWKLNALFLGREYYR
ncbi:MAG: glycoside hydrolase family 95 protein [Defluviitaleaceae bacterium]|nr:glycoside hydrolase family 95 protein [Defluviitaleaceae bacterium]